jgi:hypothetical protein
MSQVYSSVLNLNQEPSDGGVKWEIIVADKTTGTFYLKTFDDPLAVVFWDRPEMES